MKIAICSSLDFIQEIKEISEKLKEIGHEVVLPQTAEMIFGGELTHDEILEEKKNGKFAERGVRQDSLKNYFKEIGDCDAILVLNREKKGVKGYVGGAAFLETGFAHVLGKKIYFLNEIPQMAYTDEIRMMQPVVLNGNLEKIK